MMRLLGLILLICLALGSGAQAAQRGVRVQLRAGASTSAPVAETVRLYESSHALVIGNDRYEAGWPLLSNGVRDARAVAAALERQGFDVTLKTNLKSVELKRALEDFFVVAGDDPKARLFVWFAGHGHTLNGEGFIVPIDAPRPEVRAQFRLKALSLRRFGEYVRLAQAKHAYVVFDSCFAGTVFDGRRALPPAAVTRATTLPVRQFLTSGDIGQTVSDDGTFRSLFLRALSGDERADANGDGYLTASEMGLFLSSRVTNLTQSRQTPRYGKLRDAAYDRGDFVFVLPGAAASTPALPDTDEKAFELTYWRSIQSSRNVEVLETYLKRYPTGAFANLARARIRELNDTKAPTKVALLAPKVSWRKFPGQRLTVASWGGPGMKDKQINVFFPFFRATGARIEMDEHKANLSPLHDPGGSRNPDWDVVELEYRDLERACSEGHLAPLNLDDLPAGADGSNAQIDFISGTLHRCGVPSKIWSLVVAYNGEAFDGRAPSRLADFFDLEKFPGRRGVRNKAQGILEMALLADGVSPRAIYLELATQQGQDRAFEKLGTIRDQIEWWDGGARAIEMLVDREVALSTTYNGRAFIARYGAKEPIETIWDGQVWALDYWAILASSEAKDAAFEFIRFATSAPVLARQAERVSYGPARRSALRLVGKHYRYRVDMLPHLPTEQGNFNTAISNSDEFWKRHGEQLQRRLRDFMN